MKRLIFIGLLCLGVLNIHAQCAAKNDAILPGEHLTYELKFNWKFIWVSAGKAQMDLKATTYQGKPCYKTELLSVSNKKVDFFFKMRDTLTTVFTPDMRPIYYHKASFEGKRYYLNQVWYDYSNPDSIKINQSSRRDQEAVKTRTDYSATPVYDMMSLLAYARTIDFSSMKEGQRLTFPVATGKRIETQHLIYRGKTKMEKH